MIGPRGSTRPSTSLALVCPWHPQALLAERAALTRKAAVLSCAHGTNRLSYHLSLDETFKAVLGTNFVPSDEECRRIRNLLVAPIDELEETKREITRLKLELEELARKRDELTEHIDLHLALVSPARRLPEDVVREIFTASIPSDRHPSLSTKGSPVAMTLICSDWRRVALSMPRLWTSLHVEMPESSSFKLAHTRLQSWLLRSAHLPLSISISFPYGGSESLLPALIQHSDRWEHIRITGDTFDKLSPLKTLSPRDVPLLKTISTMVRCDEIESDPHSFSFLGAKSIRGISIDRDRPFPDFQALISWSQLRQLSFEAPFSVGEALAILRQCPNLETWRLSICEDYTDVGPPLPPIYTDRMREVSVVDITTHVNTPLFQHAVFPNLERLEYRHKSMDPVQIISSLRAPDKLASLSLSGRLTADSLSQILPCLPMLQQLILYQPRSSLTNNGVVVLPLFRLLNTLSPAPDTMLCPQLQRICSLGLDVGSDQELLDLIHARRATADVRPLLHLDLALTRPPQLALSSQIGNADIAVALRYPTERKLAFIARPRMKPKAPLKKLADRPPPEFRDTGADFDEMQAQSDPEADWAPMSNRWMAEYEEWGLNA
jgi:hypothetical protein